MMINYIWNRRMVSSISLLYKYIDINYWYMLQASLVCFILFSPLEWFYVEFTISYFHFPQTLSLFFLL